MIAPEERMDEQRGDRPVFFWHDRTLAPALSDFIYFSLRIRICRAPSANERGAQFDTTIYIFIFIHSTGYQTLPLEVLRTLLALQCGFLLAGVGVGVGGNNDWVNKTLTHQSIRTYDDKMLEIFYHKVPLSSTNSLGSATTPSDRLVDSKERILGCETSY